MLVSLAVPTFRTLSLLQDLPTLLLQWLLRGRTGLSESKTLWRIISHYSKGSSVCFIIYYSSTSWCCGFCYL